MRLHSGPFLLARGRNVDVSRGIGRPILTMLKLKTRFVSRLSSDKLSLREEAKRGGHKDKGLTAELTKNCVNV